MGDFSSDSAESVDGKPLPAAAELEAEKARLDALRKITWQYVMKGEKLEH